MKIKKYKISKFRVITRTMFNVLLLFLLGGFVFFTINALKGFFYNNIILGYIGIGFLFLSGYAIYYFGTVFKLFYQYYKNDKNREISIDFKNNCLIINNTNESLFEKFNELNLKRIEFNISTKDSRNLTSEYDFVKLITIDEKEYFNVSSI